MKQEDISHYLVQFSYLGIYLWFAVIEQLTPIPEEVSLTTLGYLVRNTHLNPFLSALVCFLGLTTTDSVFFLLAQKGSALTSRLQRKISGKWKEKIARNLEKHQVATILVLGLIPKLRFLSPIVCAGAGVSWPAFLLVNGLATLGYVVFYLVAGMFFHQRLGQLFSDMAVVGHILFAVAMIVAAYFLVRWVTWQIEKS